MIKYIITIVFLIQAGNCFSQQLLARVLLNNKSQEGHKVEMFYHVGSIGDLKNTVSDITHFTEREILKAFGMPLVEPGSGQEKCETSKKPIQKNARFFHKAATTEIHRNDYDMTLSLTYTCVEFCVFDLHDKYWGSYDVAFKQAAVITSREKCRKKIPETDLTEIKRLLEKIPQLK